MPEAYRRLSPALLRSLICSLPGFPGPIWAGGTKSSFLFTASDTFFVTADWNPADNISHGVGSGGKGATSVLFTAPPPIGNGGGGGSGAAYANKLNMPGIFGDQFQVIVGTSGGDTSLNATDMLAVGGNNGSGPSGGTSNGGIGGQASACIGDFRSSGADGGTVSGVSGSQPGGDGGGAGGPHGDGLGPAGDYPYGGFDWYTTGDYDWDNQNFSKPGSGEGWNYNVHGLPNAGSGGGSQGNLATGPDAGIYGGGSAAGGFDGTTHPGGAPADGCVLIINNTSL